MKEKPAIVTNENLRLPLPAADLMPNDKFSNAILVERAKHLAAHKKLDAEKGEKINYIRFSLGANEYFGIPYHDIEEVIDNAELTALPRAQAIVAGIINYHGSLLTIIDFKNFLYNKKFIKRKGVYIIVVKSQGLLIGVAADNIEGIDQYDKEVLNKFMPYDGVIDSQFMLGLHHGTTAILNISAICVALKQALEKKSGEF